MWTEAFAFGTLASLWVKLSIEDELRAVAFYRILNEFELSELKLVVAVTDL